MFVHNLTVLRVTTNRKMDNTDVIKMLNNMTFEEDQPNIKESVIIMEGQLYSITRHLIVQEHKVMVSIEGI